jgi:hypothetical protein
MKESGDYYVNHIKTWLREANDYHKKGQPN